MKCYNCGCTLSENDFCTGCGADVKVYKRIMHLSNRYYNDGLKRAEVRDLSGAAASLRQSLKCNKSNVDARNLLGLVYFEMGEAVAALSEWVISKNLKPKKNIADDFISQIQSNPTKLDSINQTIKKYNQALAYCHQDSLDLAVIQLKKVLSLNPNMIKGYQLLTLLYMNSEDWEKARRTIQKAARIDTSNTTTLYYIREIDKMLESKEEPADHKKKNQAKVKDDIITYQSGNETIIQPLNSPEKSGGATVLNIVIGMVIGLAIMWFLVVPAKVQSEKADINKNLVDVSDQLTVKSASIDELEKRVEALQGENTDLQSQLEGFTGNDGVLKANDALMQAAEKYLVSPDAVLDTADIMKNIDESYVTGSETSENFKSLYQYLHTEVSVKAAAEYLKTGLAALKKNDFATAISDLTKAYETDDTNAEALYNLAHAYRKSENASKADELYNEVISKFPDSDYAKNAKDYLSGAANASANANVAAQENTAGTAANTPANTAEPTLPAVAPIVPAADPNAAPADTGTPAADSNTPVAQ